MPLITNPLPPRPTRSLKNKVAIVTGAGAKDNDLGIGRAASILLAEAGCNVVCVDKSLSAAGQTVSTIEGEGAGRAIAVEAEVTDDGACRGVVEAAMTGFGRLDILVNNVGIVGAGGTVMEVDLEGWDRGMLINVKSMVLMARYAIPAMLKSTGVEGNGGFYRGAIVNMGSVAGLRGGTESVLYPTTKGAVVQLTRAMAYQHASQGIRVNCVCPGMLYTPMMYGEGMTAEIREARRNRSLLKTEGNAWDAGAAVKFLAGDEARYVGFCLLEGFLR